MKYQDLFKSKKPVIAMLHLKSDENADMLTRAKKEIEIFYGSGIDAVLVENYFGSNDDCENVLRYLRENYSDKIYGVNILGGYVKAFELAERYGAKFIQIDSVCGHLTKEFDAEYARALGELRNDSDALVFGGVRFKYQPVKSGRTLEKDLELGMERCDAIVVTGDGTGHQTPKDKMTEFRKTVGAFPLITGAGVTADNVEEALSVTDGIIIGSWLKNEHRDYGDVCEEYVKTFMERVASLQ